jgi:hypothetical protein
VLFFEVQRCSPGMTQPLEMPSQGETCYSCYSCQKSLLLHHKTISSNDSRRSLPSKLLVCIKQIPQRQIAKSIASEGLPVLSSIYMYSICHCRQLGQLSCTHFLASRAAACFQLAGSATQFASTSDFPSRVRTHHS